MPRRSSTGSRSGGRRLLHLDPFSGIAGNMFVAALLDLGLSRKVLDADLAGLGVEFELEVTRVPFRLGETVEAPGGYRIEVVEATANYHVDPDSLSEIRDTEPLGDQYPARPGVWVHITPPGGGEHERRLVLESVDAEHAGKQGDYEYDDLVLKLEWERWACAGPPRPLRPASPSPLCAIPAETARRARRFSASRS